MNNIGRNLKIIWGLDLILLGVALVGHFLDKWDINLYLGAFLFLPGLLSFLLNGLMTTNVLLTLLGASLLVYTNWGNQFVLPIVLILMGVFILLGNFFKELRTKKKT